MTHFDDDGATSGTAVSAAPADEADLERRTIAGDRQAFDLLYDRYFARMAWYFTIFSQREAKTAIREVMVELFGSLAEPSEHSLAKRAYQLARAIELRHGDAREAIAPARAAPATVEVVKEAAVRTVPSRS